MNILIISFILFCVLAVALLALLLGMRYQAKTDVSMRGRDLLNGYRLAIAVIIFTMLFIIYIIIINAH
ncbi:hypothetical protein KTT_32080 [Tengunoibacter tsumagoiensis]|uniref:HIG1 domain-containing protein n=1 Tax=Tengunoibacter tsumagoiensis TaxID=2014871 RepID=A0A402A2R7_9CHLR|nr:hypothetical protein KTT_32080 [Tengunoibacter tsumagoiensis]